MYAQARGHPYLSVPVAAWVDAGTGASPGSAPRPAECHARAVKSGHQATSRIGTGIADYMVGFHPIWWEIYLFKVAEKAALRGLNGRNGRKRLF